MLYVNNIICEFHCEVLGLFTRLTILYKKKTYRLHTFHKNFTLLSPVFMRFVKSVKFVKWFPAKKWLHC